VGSASLPLAAEEGRSGGFPPALITDGEPGEGYQTAPPTPEQLQQATEALLRNACAPFDLPKLRNAILDLRRKNEQIIDTVSQDEVISAGFDIGAEEKARTVINTFKQFIEENKDELTALQIIYSKPYGERHLTDEAIRQLAAAIESPPYRLTKEGLWEAYAQLEQSKVRGAGPQKLLTDIISLIRFAVGESAVLEPFAETVNRRFDAWLAEQSRTFTPEQMAWLKMIKDHIVTSLSIRMEDFEDTPFHQKGAPMKIYQLFGDELPAILAELNERLAA